MTSYMNESFHWKGVDSIQNGTKRRAGLPFLSATWKTYPYLFGAVMPDETETVNVWVLAS